MPGEYTIDAVIMDLFAKPAPKMAIASLDVSVGSADVGALVIRPTPGVAATGRITLYLEPGEELDPDRLTLFTTAATRLELRDGESRALDLRVSDF